MEIAAFLLIAAGLLLIVLVLFSPVKKSTAQSTSASALGAATRKVNTPTAAVTPLEPELILPNPHPIPERIVPPDIFDPARIQDDLSALVALQDASAFQRYKARLKRKFRKSEELAVIDSWVEYYEKAKQLVETKTALDSALTDHSRQQHIKTKEQERDLAMLNADIHEADLRAEAAKVKKDDLRKPKEQPASALKPHEQARLGAQAVMEENFKHEIYKQLQAKFFTLDELLKVKNQLVQEALALKLPADETQTRIDLVYRIYEEEKRKIMGEDQDLSPYEKE